MFCFHLASKLGMSVYTLLHTMDSKEISEWMAYEISQSPERLEQRQKERELERARNMSDDEQLAAFRAMLKGK